MSEVKGTYPVGEQGNFKILDTIRVPHPYCITPKHLEYCDSMYLNAESIVTAESRGAKCDICRKAVKAGKQAQVLSYAEHERALLVECKIEIQPTPEELHTWLLSIKAEAEKNGYAGFAFMQAK